jgi:hypothetical protein
MSVWGVRSLNWYVSGSLLREAMSSVLVPPDGDTMKAHKGSALKRLATATANTYSSAEWSLSKSHRSNTSITLSRGGGSTSS